MGNSADGSPVIPDGVELAGFRVRGRVQGVGFRWWTMQTSCGLGIRGQVRNTADGNVEVVAVGTADQLRRLERALERGPPASRVSQVEAFDPERVPSGDGFEIAR